MPAAINPEKNPTVLVVDDDPESREHLRAAFAEAGYRSLSADASASALRLLRDDLCDLAVLNFDLENNGGAALCKLLRSQPGTSRMPIIALTADENEGQRIEALAAGADESLPRSAATAEVVSRANAHLRAAQREWALIGSNRELSFLADLGRGLLKALEPEQLVRRVAGATYESTGAAMCAAFVKLSDTREAGCIFDREGSAEDASLLELDRLRSWLEPAAVSTLISDKSAFFIRDEKHEVEYAAPMKFGGRAKGALIVAFDKREACDETERRLIDAAAQQAALAAHISTLYQTARDASTSLAAEVERRTAEVEAQRRFIEAIIDSLPLSLYAINRDYRVVAWNRNRELGELGIPRGSALGKNIFSVLTRQRRDLLQAEFARVFETGQIERIEHETSTASGEVKHWLISKIPMWIDPNGPVSHVITVGEDITARVEANRAVARAEKIAAIGRLAAGVVHEINNPLATIAACAEALESRVNEGEFKDSAAVDDLREYLGLIRSEAFRCKTITNGLLDFSRTRPAAHAPVSLGDIISSAIRLLAHQQRANNINFQIETASDLPLVSGDEGQLQQAIIALGTNAIDAMPAGGQLRIISAKNGENVCVEVSDNGAGIAPENVAKIFEPFFTTKEVGKGTGLGLAVCYGILTEHGGTLDVQSTVGVGTTFTISLPAIIPDGEQD
ncbi:MAG TPA: ATP-binding protein [Pyrinomonadaceae bacterium]|nr:ATP-binding protein [Pyrinomonadaceae bacterium]